MTSQNRTNALTRLLPILRAASQHDNNRAAVETWSAVLEFEPIDLERVISTLYRMRRQLDDARRSALETPLSPTIVNEAFSTILQAFQIERLFATWNSTKVFLSVAELNVLELAANVSAKDEPEQPPELIALRESLEELLKEIASSELPDHVQRVLHDLSVKMKEALAEYSTRGPVGIWDAVGQIQQDVERHAPLIAPYRSTRAVKKFGRAVATASLVAAAIIKAPEFWKASGELGTLAAETELDWEHLLHRDLPPEIRFGDPAVGSGNKDVPRLPAGESGKPDAY